MYDCYAYGFCTGLIAYYKQKKHIRHSWLGAPGHVTSIACCTCISACSCRLLNFIVCTLTGSGRLDAYFHKVPILSAVHADRNLS